jgi:4-hydroxy-3-methylbut-2-enyl diphosphate reductase
VDRAIRIVELAIEKHGAPVYVRHEIVHNKHVLQDLRAKGAVFVKELGDIPPEDAARGAPVIFSAHGVPKQVPEAAAALNMLYIDATCPLVSKVHREAELHSRTGHHIILIGHRNHPEVIGTMGQLPEGAVTLVEDVHDVAALSLPEDAPVAFVTQTTLSVDDTAHIVAALQAKYPHVTAPRKEDICYATTNRQMAVKDLAQHSEAVVVIGSKNSSNSHRLVEVAKAYGARQAWLADHADDLPWDEIRGMKTLGLTAGASAPEHLVQDVIARAREYFDVTVQDSVVARETVTFKIPRILAT